MSIPQSMKRLESLFRADAERNEGLLQLAMILNRMPTTLAQKQQDSFWEITTACKTVDDVAVGQPFLTITGGGMTLNVLAPLDVKLPWEHRWDIIRDDDVLAIKRAPGTSKEDVNTLLLAKVEEIWPGDRMEGAMASAELNFIIHNYKRIVDDFSFLLVALTVPEDEDNLTARKMYAARAIEAVNFLHNSEAFLSSLSRGERMSLARWQRSYAREGSRLGFAFIRTFAIRWAIIGAFLMAISLVLSLPPLLRAVTVGMMLPAVIIGGVGATVGRIKALREANRKAEEESNAAAVALLMEESA